jgi:hypothetical protein
MRFMATQGLLSITRAGKVVAKIVTGCDGQNIVPLAASLRKNPTTDPDELLKRCREHDLGGNSLIVQSSPDSWRCDGESSPDGWRCDSDTEEVPELYKAKFYEPRFNPRWLNGTAEYTEVVELETQSLIQMSRPRNCEVRLGGERKRLYET